MVWSRSWGWGDRAGPPVSLFDSAFVAARLGCPVAGRFHCATASSAVSPVAAFSLWWDLLERLGIPSHLLPSPPVLPILLLPVPSWFLVHGSIPGSAMKQWVGSLAAALDFLSKTQEDPLGFAMAGSPGQRFLCCNGTPHWSPLSRSCSRMVRALRSASRQICSELVLERTPLHTRFPVEGRKRDQS